MKFCWATLTVKNMEESLKFYQEIVGLELESRFQAGPGLEIAFLGKGETKVELKSSEHPTEVNVGKDICLGFSTDCLDEKMEFVKSKGIEIHSGPFQPSPTIRFFYVLDPNGLKIQFVEQK